MCEQCLYEKVCKYKKSLYSIRETISRDYDNVFLLECSEYKHDEGKFRERLAEFDEKHGIKLGK